LPSYNLELSKKRAKSVYNEVLSRGISNQRLSFEGLGDTSPISTNKSEAGRSINRRTEIVIKKFSK
jgi:outer membrane protein OmpA-like peptidoglycan-associated protein